MTPNRPSPPDSSLTLADHIRQAYEASDLSVYQIAKQSQVDQSTLNKFLNGERENLRLDVADRVFRYLGLKVVAGKPQRKNLSKKSK